MAISNWNAGAVNETIGVGQDRANTAAFEAAHDGENPTNGTLCTGSLTGVDATAGLTYWQGWQAGQNATTRIVLNSQPGDEPDGLNDAVGTKAFLQQYMYVWASPNAIYMDILDIEWSQDDQYFIVYRATAAGELRVGKCVLRDSNDSGILATQCAVGTTVKIGGCLFKDVGTGAHEIVVWNSDDDVVISIWNCTVVGADHITAIGINNTAGTMNLTNTAMANNTNDYQGVINHTTNASENDGQITDNDFEDFNEPSVDDYRVFGPTSFLYYAGTPVVDAFFTTYCATDFQGTAWNNPPSIGAFEFQVPVPPPSTARVLRQSKISNANRVGVG